MWGREKGYACRALVNYVGYRVVFVVWFVFQIARPCLSPEFTAAWALLSDSRSERLHRALFSIK